MSDVRRYALGAEVWFRESTNEWVLEVSGSINEAVISARHTEPADTAPEDVPMLASLYVRDAQAAPEAEPVAWVPSAALAKLRNSSNNAPCVLTDGPAEFNDTAVYLAPQHDAELIELLRESKTWIDNNSCHGTDAIDLMARIDAKLATLRHV